MSENNKKDEKDKDFLKDVVVPEFVFFHTSQKEGYAKRAIEKNCNEIYNIKSNKFLEFLRSLHYKEFNKGISRSELSSIQETCNSIAIFAPDSREEEVHLRTAQKKKVIYVDLGDKTWKVVRITSEGCKIVKNINVNFHRPSGYLPLCRPDLNSKKGKGFRLLKQFFRNISNEDYRLMLCWLISAIRPSGPFPILILQGEQGAGKSTCMRFLKMLIDPFKAPIRSLPKTERDLMISALNSMLLAFDNISNLKAELPDAFCRLATGAGLSTRKLYSDDGEQFFEACRPIMLNGISDFVTKNDLASRSILLSLASIDRPDRVTEQELRKNFRDAQPAILADLYRAVSVALKNIDTVKLKNSPRMADFAAWSCAASKKVKWTHDQFLEAYDVNQKQLSDACFDADIVATTVHNFMIEALAWQGTATELLTALSKFNPEVTQTRYWPKSASKMSSRLREGLPALQEKRIEVKLFRKDDKRLIQLELLDEDDE
ncbi:MAG: hypothetical protein PF442_10690 [Desulfobulbaceae bacterium]|jgi:putative DNA primase/helicase|nr:hypothetical protein [Desulfobulbaceae bacterium]